jgi:hypothetical protein
MICRAVYGQNEGEGRISGVFQDGKAVKQNCRNDGKSEMAERAGFEPASPLPGYTLSKRAP